MAGNFDFLHIKRRTAGSSNELSLSVLDSKSAEADGKAARGSKLPRPPKASQGSYAGVGTSSTLTGRDEVERRKKARRAHRIRLQVVAVIAVVALVVAGAYAGLKYRDAQADISSRVHALVDRLSAVDDTLVEIDALMVDPLNDEKSADRARVAAAMPQLTTELNRISVDAQSLGELRLDEGTAVVVNQVNRTAQARSDMIKEASRVFQLAQEASGQVDKANRVWEDVLDNDQLAREAVSAANKATTQSATSDAHALLKQALEGLEGNTAELGNISSAYGVDFSSQKAYLEQKKRALELAIKTNEALLAGNRDEAVEANEAYNAADAEAVQLAAALPPSINELVQARFELLVAEPAARYAAARENAVSADSVIRDYLDR